MEDMDVDWEVDEDDDVDWPEPHSADDPWWSGARADW